MPQTNFERIDYENSTKLPTDLDIDYSISEIEDYESGPVEYSIHTYPADFTLEGLYTKWNNNEILIPQFQRRFVWKQVQASKLIESFLSGLPVPAIFFYIHKKSQNYLVIDGQQRLKSIFYFFEGYFGEEKKGKRNTFKLKGLNEKSHWYNMSYAELDQTDQKKLRNSVLRSFIVNQLDPNDDTSVYHIFERLNTGGTLLANQEIRNCVYDGSFNIFLHKLNNNKNWRKILGKIINDSRQRDVELILRFFSLLNISDYEPPFKEHLSKYMSKHQKASKSFLNKKEKLFNDTCNVIIENLGEKPFHIKAGINTAILDSVMINLANNLNHLPKNLKTRYKKLISNEKYQEVISGPIPNPGVIRQRFSIAKKILIG